MDERRMQIFRAVADQRNFSRAAELLHLSQPTVSQQIQTLEEELGARLLDRSSKMVELTPAGRTLYDHVVQLLQSMQELRRAVVQAAGTVSGPLTIGASMTIGEYLLPRALATFEREHPGVEIRLLIHNTERICHLVMTGQVDLGLVEGPVTSPELTEQAFLSDELVLIAHPDHDWKYRSTIAPAELLEERLVLRERGSGTRQVMEEHLDKAGVRISDLRVVTVLAGTEAIKGAVEAGMGVSAISVWTILKELRLGTLLARRLSNTLIMRTFRAVSLEGRTLIPAAQALIDSLQTQSQPTLLPELLLPVTSK